MMHEQIKCHDACPSAVQISSSSQNWLKHKVSNKTPQKFEKPLVQFVKN